MFAETTVCFLLLLFISKSNFFSLILLSLFYLWFTLFPINISELSIAWLTWIIFLSLNHLPLRSHCHIRRRFHQQNFKIENDVIFLIDNLNRSYFIINFIDCGQNILYIVIKCLHLQSFGLLISLVL